MMRHAALLEMLLVGLALISGCRPSYDIMGLSYVESYAAEIIPAVEEATLAVSGWLDGSDDGVGLDSLQSYADKIKSINERYWTDEFPDDTKIEKWRISRSIDDLEWTIKGSDLADALWFVGADSDYLAGALELVVEKKGNLNEDEYLWVVGSRSVRPRSGRASAQRSRRVVPRSGAASRQ